MFVLKGYPSSYDIKRNMISAAVFSGDCQKSSAKNCMTTKTSETVFQPSEIIKDMVKFATKKFFFTRNSCAFSFSLKRKICKTVQMFCLHNLRVVTDLANLYVRNE